MSYILSGFLGSAIKLMERNGGTFFLKGPPGTGKTSLAAELSRRLGAPLQRYQCAEDKSRNLLYEIDVQGVIKREAAWVKGPCWRAFDASHKGRSILLIDEVDKASPGFDPFLLQILEEGQFLSPQGETISARKDNLTIFLTTNGRRELRPELQRRGMRIEIPHPTTDKLIEIIKSVDDTLPEGMVRLLAKIRDIAITEKIEPEEVPSPKELALLGRDCLYLKDSSSDVFLSVAGTWLEKETKWVSKIGFNLGKALSTEAGAARKKRKPTAKKEVKKDP